MGTLVSLAVIVVMLFILVQVHKAYEASAERQRRRDALLEQSMLDSGLLRPQDLPFGGKPRGIDQARESVAADVDSLGAPPEVVEAVRTGDWSKLGAPDTAGSPPEDGATP